ncbi:MAG: PhnD/SsuA/transferrin family substrate-binding protein [Chloroflexota bacterium]
MNKRLLKTISLIILLILLSLTLIGCKPATGPRPSLPYTETPTSTPTPIISADQTSTQRPSHTPTPEALGHASNPIVMGFIQSEHSTIQKDAADALAEYLSDKTNQNVIARFFLNYKWAEKALQAGSLHMVWLEPIEYLLAGEQTLASVALVTNHFGVTAYGVQFLANNDFGFTPYFDIDQNHSTTDIKSALAQFSGTRPCFTEENSLAAYLVPKGMLLEASVPILDPVMTYSSTASIRALYTQGICDFGVTYALSGDPRTASAVIQDFPGVMDQVHIIWQSDGIIPNLILAYSLLLSLPIQEQLSEALITLSRTTDGQITLSNANDYSIEGLQRADDTLFDKLRALLAIQNVDLYSLIDKE